MHIVIFERLFRREDFFIRNSSGTYIVPCIALHFDINDNVVLSSHVYV